MKYLELSKVCENCGETYKRKKGEFASNFKRNKTCSRKCRYERLERNSTHIDDKGYLRFNRTMQRYHRYVMEQHLGRKLETHEEVHHIDENKLNNSVDNLVVLTKAEHTRITFKGKRRSNSWRVNRGLEPI